MNNKVYPNGVIGFAPNDGAPDFVLGSLLITLEDFTEWVINEGKKYEKQYKGKRQIKLNILKGKEGKLNIQVDTYKPTNQLKQGKNPKIQSANDSDDLPF